MPTPSTSPVPSGNDSRLLDAHVSRLVRAHPTTASMLVYLRWFPRARAATRYLRRLEAEHRVRRVGTLARGPGRPEHVYCRWQPTPGTLHLEVQLTEICLRLHAGKLLRATEVTDPVIRPDAQLWISGRLYHLELDRGTMSAGEIVRRFEEYRGCPHLSLWLCADDERREEMVRRADPLRGHALFTTVREAIDGPHRPIWRDGEGNTVPLPREPPVGGTQGQVLTRGTLPIPQPQESRDTPGPMTGDRRERAAGRGVEDGTQP